MFRPTFFAEKLFDAGAAMVQPGMPPPLPACRWIGGASVSSLGLAKFQIFMLDQVFDKRLLDQ